jgi:ribosomal-protein-alanine N-acetyltransferase
VIETPRLTLRPFTLADAPDHARLYADPEVTRFLGGGPFDPAVIPERSRRTVERFARHWVERGWGVWAVRLRETGRFIGQCGLQPLPGTGDVELLYALARDQWGRGLATEAGAAALRHGFAALGLPRIVAVTRPEHLASRAVMEKLGMRYEGPREVYGVQAVCYALSRETFAARQPAGR